MYVGGIDFPDEVIDALRDNHLVVFAGTGVSMGEPASLPDFADLADRIAQGSGMQKEGREAKDREPEDRFIGRLHSTGIRIHEIAASLLSDGKGKRLEPTGLHRNLVRLFREPDQVRVVTTNLDILFERAMAKLEWQPSRVYSAPALPLGREFAGIVHVHGSVDEPQNTVLTDSDFGRAYLTEGWARRFLMDLFLNFTALFVGYSHDDTVMQYLARALPQNGGRNRFALCGERDEGAWEFLGIQPVRFSQASDEDFSALNQGVAKLAVHSNRGFLEWREDIQKIAEKEPPIDPEAVDTVEHAFKDKTLTGFFTKSARSVAWIPWLHKRGLLNPLFSHEPLDDSSHLLACWLAKEYAVRFPAEVMLLIGANESVKRTV